MNNFDKIEEAIEDIKKGKMVIVLDDEDRENEGDFVAAAELVTPEMINFMAKIGRGLICTPLTKEDATRLELPMMVEQNNSCHETAFTISIDSKNSGTGISAFDRAITIKEMVDKKIPASTFLKPGHVFPLIAKDGGVLERDGHTEAAVDLAKLAGLYPMGIICEVMSEDGSMARRDELFDIAKNHDLKIITIDDLKKHLSRRPELKKEEVINLPTEFGDFKMHLFEDDHMALVMGNVLNEENTLTRVHSECLTGDVFGSKRCDCGDQLKESMRMISEKGSGAIIYLKQEGRGIGLKNKIRAYKLQEKGLDTVTANLELGFESDQRTYDIAANILSDLGIFSIDLLTNNPIKITSLKNSGIKINKRIPLIIKSNIHNDNYIKTKIDKMGHLYDNHI